MSPKGGKRVGAGRPKTLNEPVNVVLRIEKDLLVAAKTAALQKGKSLSEVVRGFLRSFVGGRRKPRPRRKEKRRQS
jgi:hypothetical protein